MIWKLCIWLIFKACQRLSSLSNRVTIEQASAAYLTVQNW